MRIAYWNSGFFCGYGGAEFHSAEMINALARRGETCFMLASTSGPNGGSNITPELDDRIQVHQGAFQNPLIYRNGPIRFLYQIISYLFSACGLVVWLIRNRVDVVHLHFVGIDVVLLSFMKHFFGFRLVLTFHGMELEFAADSILSDWKNRLALRNADHVTTVSRNLAERLRKRYSATHIHVIPIPINVDKIRQLAKLPWELAMQPGHFVFCGRIDPEKQIPGLVETFGLAIQRGCTRNLYIMGDGTDETHVQSVVNRLDLHHRVYLLGAHTRHEALRMINESHCVLLNSHSEGYPLVILEAMALGKPIIAPDVGGIGEMVAHDHDALLFPANDAEALCSAILRLDKDESCAARLGGNAGAAVTAKAGVDAVVDSYLELYRSNEKCGQT